MQAMYRGQAGHGAGGGGGLAATALGARLPAHLEARGLIRPGEVVVAAVSGGLDSVVLLHTLRFLLEPWALRLVVAHFDHRMREGSEADADWVAGLCRAWGVPCERGVARRALRSEAEARAARYTFLREVAARHGAARIATAHHADDQAETVLFRIVRGTGLGGLRGIRERWGPLVRPLLPFRRAELAAYATAAGLRYREDPTNWSLSYARNRLRHEILPRLEEVSPGATGALVRLAEQARESEEAWDWILDRCEREVVVGEADGAVELARAQFLSYHPHIRARLIRRLLRRYGSLPDRAGTRAALEFISFGESGGRVEMAGGVRIEREFDRIRIGRFPGKPGEEERPLAIPEPGSGEGEVVLGGRRYRVRWAVDGGAEWVGAETFDLGALRFPLEVRAWRPGDRIRLPYGTKKLKKLFSERRVGRRARMQTPVLAEPEGRVLWVAGVARAAGLDPAPGRSVFRVAVSDADGAPESAGGRRGGEAARVEGSQDD
jgi:tRNA(Ile)-lysidine synthase